MRPKVLILGLLFAILLFASLSYSQLPQMINYQGKITTPQGALIDTIVSIEFCIYGDTTGMTAPLWSETQDSIKVEKGVFSVLLGDSVLIPFDVFNGEERYLGISVGDDPEMRPLKPMVSVPYAFMSLTAQCWQCPNVIPGVTYLADPADWVGIGTNSPVAKLHVNDAEYGIYVEACGSGSYGLRAKAMPDTNTGGDAIAVKGESGPSPGAVHAGDVYAGYFSSLLTLSNNSYGVYAEASGADVANYGIYAKVGSGQPGYAGYFDGDKSYFSGSVGIGRANPENRLHVHGAINLDPITAPANPSTGFVIYVDVSDGKLKAKSHLGNVTILANP